MVGLNRVCKSHHNSSTTVTMPRSAKRRREVIDLTEDDGSGASQPKKVATSASQPGGGVYASTGIGGSRVYNGDAPPSSAAEPEQFDLTQDEGPERELYGSLDGKIVGVRYYNGFASLGEVVLCRREPNNQYDRNAIRVDNVLYQQIGHLPRKVVEKIAPYIDRGEIALEAQITGRKEHFDCPVKLLFFGSSDPTERARLETALKNDKLLKATQLKQTRKEAEARRALMNLKNGGTTVGLGSDATIEEKPELSLEDILQTSEALGSRQESGSLKTLAVDEKVLSKMPLAEQPAQLKATLLPYQRQGLAWLTSQEAPQLPEQGTDTAVQLWKQDGNGRYWNAASHFVTSSPPKLLSGGILADDMGLGKTLQIISLILTGGPGSTLIVAPVSVMSNWEQQIRRHVREEYMPSILVYHGDKKLGADDLMRYDVVITSYGRLARERDAGVNKALLSQAHEWRRVVLDEGHTIRNAKTKVAQAACEVKAQSRWVLTGTPIVNSVKDLQSLVKFLHITGGIEQPEVFDLKITRRLGTGDRDAEALLQSLIHDICLRRKKEMAFVDLKLPAKKEYLHRIAFRDEEKQKYDALMSEARGLLEEYQAKSNNGQKGRFSSVLERLLRLRQTQRIDDLLKLLEDQEVVVLNDKNRSLLQEALRLYMENQEDCAICYDIPTGPVITNCKHVFCRPCISKAIEIQHKCPMCRNPLTQEALLEPTPEGQADDNFDTETQSSKTEAMMHIIRATLKNPGSKLIIFSQWTSFLSIVQNQLVSAGIKYSRLDGSMNADKRDQAVHALDNDADTRIMLASLAVCSVGLNLVSADTVILSDSWWAPAIEDQAIDRVHRLGQTRETTVWRLVMEGSVEERVLDIQQEKRDLVNKAFQEKGGKKKKAKNTSMADVMKLLA
ncbi:matrix-associated actin-dependent regulator [Paramyrothecium foliicola]|nr:matrix-associated actin-dependent regulator [Paramyrothecium foliicola]